MLAEVGMKSDIHPEYRDVLFHDTSSDTYFIVGSTVQTSDTKEHEGQTYPYMILDISSASHPFYTGKQRWLRATAVWQDSTSASGVEA